MKALLELHLIQNFAPSNLNRDDTGSPKDAYFGGVRRTRVSSQSFKRAMRMDFRSRGILAKGEIGERTKRGHEVIRDLLMAHGQKTPQEATRAAELALRGLGLPVKEGKSQYFLFLGQDELQRVADIILHHWDAAFAGSEPVEAEDGRKKTKASKKADLPGDLSTRLQKALNGSRAVDIALFGRMLADLPEKNIDAAAQVAHALGTHAMSRREFDFFTAVDDLKPGATAGADMLGTVEFGSATFYRYVCLDLTKLRENLGNDDELLLRGLKALLYASIFALPTGKQNTFAAHNHPSLISTVIRENASPRNLANAFEVPVKAKDGSYIASSIRNLSQEWEKQDRIFGQPGRGRYINAHDELNLAALGEKARDVEALIQSLLDDVTAVLGRMRNP